MLLPAVHPMSVKSVNTEAKSKATAFFMIQDSFHSVVLIL
jgi:hypothetical protein